MDAPNKVTTKAFIQSDANISVYQADVFVSKERMCLGFYGGSDRKVLVDIVGAEDVKAFCEVLSSAIRDEEIFDD